MQFGVTFSKMHLTSGLFGDNLAVGCVMFILSLWQTVNPIFKAFSCLKILKGPCILCDKHFTGFTACKSIIMRRKKFLVFAYVKIVHFTVVCFGIWPLSGSEAGGDLVLIQTSCFSYVNAN